VRPLHISIVRIYSSDGDSMKFAHVAVLLVTLSGCAASPPSTTMPLPPPPPGPSVSDATLPPLPSRALTPFAEEVASDLRTRLGSKVVDEVLSATSFVMVTFQQALPRPVQKPNGSWSFDGPAGNALMRTRDGWVGWRDGQKQAIAPAISSEIDAILRDNAFWGERDYNGPPRCMDGGARRTVVRLGSRSADRQQSCEGEGLTERLFGLVFQAD